MTNTQSPKCCSTDSSQIIHQLKSAVVVMVIVVDHNKICGLSISHNMPRDCKDRQSIVSLTCHYMCAQGAHLVAFQNGMHYILGSNLSFEVNFLNHLVVV